MEYLIFTKPSYSNLHRSTPRSTRYPAACTPCDLCSLRPVYRTLVWKYLQLRDRRPPACAPGRGLVTRRDPRPARRGSSHLRSRANSLEVYADGPAAHRRDQTQGASVVVPRIRGRAATQGVRMCGAGRLRQPGSRARTSLAYPLQPSSTGGSRDCRPGPLPSSLWTLDNWSALSLQYLPLRRVAARLGRPGDACNWCSSVVRPGLLLDLSYVPHTLGCMPHQATVYCMG